MLAAYFRICIIYMMTSECAYTFTGCLCVRVVRIIRRGYGDINDAVEGKLLLMLFTNF